MKIFETILLITVVFHISCAKKEPPPTNLAFDALRLAIDRSISNQLFFGEYEKSIFNSDKINCNVYLIPLNQEIINASIEYKSYIEALDSQAKKNLSDYAHQVYINGNQSVFLLIANVYKYQNEPIESDDIVHFKNFRANTFLHDENRKYNLIKYTHSFDEPLKPGINKAYLYFNNFRKNKENYSYSMHFNNFIISANKNLGKPTSNRWAFSFDESAIDFYALLEKGISDKEIREGYNIPSSTSNGLSFSDYLNIASIIVTAISMGATLL